MHRPGIIVGALLAVAGCSEPAQQDAAYVVAIDKANAARVDEDTLTFPANMINAEIRQKIDAYDHERGWFDSAGDVDVEQVLFVSDRQNFVTNDEGMIDRYANNPYGFIRRALSYEVTGQDIIIDTEQASLADVWKELEASGQVAITSDYPRPQHDETVYIDKSGLELWKNGTEYIRFPTLYINIDPQVDLDVSIGMSGVKNAMVALSANMQSVIVVDAQLSQLPEQALKQTIYEQDYKLAPLGIIPVSLRVKVDVGCEKTGGQVNIEGGVKTTSSLRGELKYDRTTGTKLGGTGTVTPELVGTEFEVVGGGQAELRCSAYPVLAVMFYDRPVGAIIVNAKTRLAISSPPDTLVAEASLRADVHGLLSVIGVGPSNGEAPLLDVNKTLWNGPVP